MKHTCCRVVLHLTLVMSAAFLSQLSSAQEPKAQFKYSDEWSLVSAPPPAGPYQPVNIDPRVPGPGTVQQVPMGIPRLQSAQEMPGKAVLQGQSIGAQSEQTAREEAAATVSQQQPMMPPVPGHYQVVMPAAVGDLAVEPAAQASVIAQPEQVVEPPVIAGQDKPALLPMTSTASKEPAVVEQAAAAVSQQVPVMPPAPGHYQAVTPAAVGDLAVEPAAQASVIAQPEQVVEPPAIAAQDKPAVLPVTATASKEQAVVEQATAAVSQQVPVMPPTAHGVAEMPVVEASATAMQPPAMPAQVPGYYEHMPPPAAGRVTQQPAVEGPAASLQDQPGERPSAPGYYGRPMPSTPGFSYPAPGRYPYQSVTPGYGNMPPYGYNRGQGWTEEQSVPPPPVYDSTQYPRRPAWGYR